MDERRWQQWSEGYEQGKKDWPFRTAESYPADSEPFPTIDWLDGYMDAQRVLDYGQKSKRESPRCGLEHDDDIPF